MSDILNARAPAAMPYSTSPADLAIWRDAVQFQMRAAVCAAIGHPMAPEGVNALASVRVAADAAALALKAHGSTDRKCRMPDHVAAWVVHARDLLAMAAERLEGGEA